MEIVLIYLLVINLITCIVYGVDKLKSIAGRWRTPEKTLLSLAFAGGSLGALAGMMIFRHKTRHLRFRILVPLFLVLHIALLVFLYIKLWA